MQYTVNNQWTPDQKRLQGDSAEGTHDASTGAGVSILLSTVLSWAVMPYMLREAKASRLHPTRLGCMIHNLFSGATPAADQHVGALVG